MRKRELRVRKESGRIGTKKAGHGWAARQAARKYNRGRRITMKAIRRQQRKRGG